MKPEMLDEGKVYSVSELRNVLTELKVSGFKAFCQEEVLPIAPITLVFGKNSCGKSALVQSLALMRQMLETDDADLRYAHLGSTKIDVGGFDNYVNRTLDTNRKEVKIDVKFTNRMHRDRVTSYGVTMGENPLTDNQWARDSEYGKDLKYTSKNIRVVKNGLRLVVRMNESLKGVEDQQFPYSYQVQLGVTDWCDTNSGDSQFIPNERLTKEIKEALENLDVSAGTPEPVFGREAQQSIVSVARAWLKRQLRLHSYVCSGSNLHLSRFRSGGYEVLDDDISDSVDYFVSVWNPDTRDAAICSLREFIAIDCIEELSKSGLEEKELLIEVLKVIDKEIPAEFDKHCRESYSDLSQLLASLRYLGPIREMPGRILTDRFSHLDRYSANSAGSIYASIRDDAGLRNRVNMWLSDGLFSKNYSFILDDQKQLSLYELGMHKDIEVSLQDVGSGLSQVIPVITFCLGNSLKTLLLEQPELHLHPSGAAEMGDIIIQSALAEKGNTVIAETHSEHLILRILKRIRQTHEGTLPAEYLPVKPEDVSVVFVQPRDDGKGSEIIQIPITEDGDILFGWPEGFMPDRLEEMF
ncbi:MAG: AAA family ATPase [Candidatus Thorarchaeota archaeon]